MGTQHKNRPFFIKRILSFKFAFKGLLAMFRTQPNSLIHLLAALAVIALGFIYQISTIEWVVIVFAICFVFAMELINTAMEALVDLLSPDIHPRAGLAKDLAAAAVLVSAIAAAIAGLIIFIPRIF